MLNDARNDADETLSGKKKSDASRGSGGEAPTGNRNTEKRETHEEVEKLNLEEWLTLTSVQRAKCGQKDRKFT